MKVSNRTLRLIALLSVLVILCNWVVFDWYQVPTNSMAPTLKNNCILFTYRGINKNSFVYTLLHSRIHKNDVLVFKRPNWDAGTDSTEDFTYVKRCVGLPGDTIDIKHYRTEPPATKMPGQVSHMYLFPQDTLFGSWTLSDYGPFWIPKKNKTIVLNKYNVRLYRKILKSEQPTLQIKGDSVLLGGNQILSYTFQHDYYFMLGDNFFLSRDSRFFGCIPDDVLIGKVIWHS